MDGMWKGKHEKRWYCLLCYCELVNLATNHFRKHLPSRMNIVEVTDIVKLFFT
jgi:hypothetical protein